jgi:hypothetical protein
MFEKSQRKHNILDYPLFEMGLHDPFEHLKHKLSPKEGLGVKLAI